MPTVSDIVAHILHHTNAEAADSDPSQRGNVQQRAAYVRAAFQRYVADVRSLLRYTFLNEMSNVAPDGPLRASFRRVITNAEAASDDRPRLAIQAWVGKNSETRAD